jgi:hypothetical protein
MTSLEYPSTAPSSPDKFLRPPTTRRTVPLGLGVLLAGVIVLLSRRNGTPIMNPSKQRFEAENAVPVEKPSTWRWTEAMGWKQDEGVGLKDLGEKAEGKYR